MANPELGTPELSTIAQLLYPDLQTLDFARIVAELDTVLLRLRGGEVEITWDCDDLVTFDVPETRILLAWTETGTRGSGGCLTVSVGPNPAATDLISKSEHDVLCSRLVERIQGRFAPEGVLWRQVAGPVGSDYVDELNDRLPEIGTSNLPPIDSILDALSRADLQMADLKSSAPHPRSIRAPELSRLAMVPTVEEPARPMAVRTVEVGPVEVKPGHAPKPLILIPEAMLAKVAAEGFGESANDRPCQLYPENAELARLRDALYPEVGVKEPAAVYSTQMRLAAHCMNATLIVVYAPLGAAVMTYSLLRGEDMRLSSRMMAVAGTMFAVAHSPIGQTMAAMAKGIV